MVCRRHDLERAGLHVRNGINANLSDDKEILEVISGNLMGAVELDAGRDGVGFGEFMLILRNKHVHIK